ncbi:hypothetical protein CTEN210_00523 [Chaetoceros tenuissimus]|uniref:Leucine-rich repeat domain-containing protein n=1 Tax=Chaetoceros tenuissimus TaxID=426638 RepID=A0AAD3CEA5_9STRA|nr:hypothetical protein CTEN210_00523 [Chaetoceros tenuissimus]
MSVATVDGLVTLFYDGSKKLWNYELDEEWEDQLAEHHEDEDFSEWESWDLSNECKRYVRERQSWQQIIVVEGVTEITEATFSLCFNIQRVILASTVIQIHKFAFFRCTSLVYIKWSVNLEFIGYKSFDQCNFSSVFLPPTCRIVQLWAFAENKNLNIFNIPQDTEFEGFPFILSKFVEKCPFRNSPTLSYSADCEEANTWMKNINNHEDYALHRVCSSYRPLKEIIMSIIEKKGLGAFKTENSIGITPSQYLKENPYTDVTEQDIIHDYLMKMLGEVVV